MSIDSSRRRTREFRQLFLICSIACFAITTTECAGRASELKWLNDLEQAKQMAAEQHKDLFINFTGTSWCQSCMELEREVLSTDAFAPAADTFVLVRLEYPGSVPRLPQEPPAPQPTWLDQYGVDSYPTVFLADVTGKPYATTSNPDDTPAGFLKHILKLREVRQQRDAAFARAANATGAERAYALNTGLVALEGGFDDTKDFSNANPLLKFYRDEIDAVIQQDANNRAGAGDKWRQLVAHAQEVADKKVFAQELSDTYSRSGIEAVLHLLDEKTRTVSDEWKKELCWTRLAYLEQAKHNTDAIDWAKELMRDERFTTGERITLHRRVATNLNWSGRTDEALAAYDEALAEAKAIDPARQARILSDKGDVYWYANRFQESLDAHTAAIKLMEPNTVRWEFELAWQIRVFARLGRASEAWKAYDELAKSSVTTPQARLNMMAYIAAMLQEAGATEAAHDAALKTEQLLASQKDPKVDPSQAREIVDKILKPAAQNAAAENSSESP